MKYDFVWCRWIMLVICKVPWYLKIFTSFIYPKTQQVNDSLGVSRRLWLTVPIFNGTPGTHHIGAMLFFLSQCYPFVWHDLSIMIKAFLWLLDTHLGLHIPCVCRLNRYMKLQEEVGIWPQTAQVSWKSIWDPIESCWIMIIPKI